MFTDEVVKRAGHDKRIADMRGKVISIVSNGKVAMVDTNGTFVNDDGNPVRGIPIANLKLDIYSGANNPFLARIARKKMDDYAIEHLRTYDGNTGRMINKANKREEK